jgi:hypothetical protein
VLVAEMELIVWLPEVALAPDQATVAAQFEALLDDQVSSVEPPAVTVLGAALTETVGVGDVAGGCGAGGCDAPGLGVVAPSPPPPPPQATRVNMHNTANGRP